MLSGRLHRFDRPSERSYGRAVGAICREEGRPNVDSGLSALHEATQVTRVLFISYHLPTDDEPGAFRPWMEARLMVRSGCDVTVVTSGVQYMTGADIRFGRGWCTEEKREGIRILRTWALPRHRHSIFTRFLSDLIFSLLAAVASVSKVGPADRVFAGAAPIFIVPLAYLVARVKGASLILDERDLFPETAIALGVMREGVISRALFGMQQYFRRKATALLAATPGIEARLLQYGHPREKVKLLYNADVFIDESLGQTAQTNWVRKKLNEKIIIGYAGGLGRASNISTLLRAAIRLRDLEHIGFAILGSGERRGGYEAFCTENGLSNVVFLEAVARRDARRYIREFDICVQLYPVAKLFEGALPSKIFDYHALGKPIVVCGKGDVAELLRRSGAGIAVAPEDDEALADVLQELYFDEPRRRQMGQSARQWFEQNISIKQTEELFSKLLS